MSRTARQVCGRCGTLTCGEVCERCEPRWEAGGRDGAALPVLMAAAVAVVLVVLAAAGH